MGLSDDSAFSNQIAQALLSAQAKELREELKALDFEPDRIWSRSLDRAWDCWCNLANLDEWNQSGILVHRRSPQRRNRLSLLCRLDRLDSRAGFPKLEVDESNRDSAKVRFLMPPRQNLEQARTWQVEFAQLESIPNWPEMLLQLAQEELRKARFEIEEIQRKRIETQREYHECMDAWAEATWNLLKRGSWASLQGDEVHLAPTAEEAMASIPNGQKAPYWEWKHRARPTIILAVRLIQASTSGKRWLVEGRIVCDDLFSTPQGQAAFTTWKRTGQLKKLLRLHLISLLS